MPWLPSGSAERYSSPIDRSQRNDARTIALDLIGTGKRVLEVGCTTGVMSQALREQACTVVGVDIDPIAAEQARQHCEAVITGDVEQLELSLSDVGGEKFDVALFGDVLEHLKDPLAVLQRASRLLRPDGFVVASIPNVAHGSVRLALLGGRWDYVPAGLLDGTHLRFFTRESVEALFREAGLAIIELRRTVAGPFDTEIAVRREDFPPATVAQVEADPEASTYQCVVRAVPEDHAPDVVRALYARDASQQETIRKLSGDVQRLEADAAADSVELQRLRSQWERAKRNPAVRMGLAARRLARHFIKRSEDR